MKHLILLAIASIASAATIIYEQNGPTTCHHSASAGPQEVKAEHFSTTAVGLGTFTTCLAKADITLATDGPERLGILVVNGGTDRTGISASASASVTTTFGTTYAGYGYEQRVSIMLGTTFSATAAATSTISYFGGVPFSHSSLAILNWRAYELPDPLFTNRQLGAEVRIFEAIPEPSTFALAASALGLLAWRRKANPKP